ncbi:MAG TPA: histidine--tRNA ligase [Acidimicrobiia bacterium]|nr:histidine--tRNA ligase [Acidimicrobiia bacterium]
MIPPRTPPGVLELLPGEQASFRRLLDVIAGTFERFGFVEIETPVFERSEILLTKTGGDTERQIYFVQSTGSMDSEGPPDLALRFDLTVPLARYVAEHQHDLAFPFKRYQIQRVYRGERPQRGRFREFYQCDIDVIGRDHLSLRHDAELPAVIHDVFDRIGVGPFTIRISNRLLMSGLLSQLGVGDDAHPAVLREVDKLDRRTAAEVRASLVESGLDDATADAVIDLVTTRARGAGAAIEALGNLTTEDERARTGVAHLRVVFETLAELGVPDDRYDLDLGVARGLEYYTGTVYETTLDDHPEIGSVCSGGRYEDLAGLYTNTRLPGVGISIGLTRLFWQLREAGLLGGSPTSVHAYVTIMDEAGVAAALRLATTLRAGGLNTDVAAEPGRLGKQLKHADRLGVRFALIVGEDERSKGTVTVRDLVAGDQVEVDVADAADALRQRLQAGES